VGVYVFACMYTSFDVGVYICACRYTDFTSGCVYIYVYSHRVHMCLYIFTYMHTEFTCVCIHISVHAHRVYECVCRSQTVTLACVIALASRASCRR